MAIIPIKVLKDKNQEAFLPFTITDAVFIPDTNKTITDALEEQEERIDEAIESVPTKTSDLTNDSNFVSDANYVHTDNNYTDSEKSKLAGIAADAEANVLEKVKVNGTEQTITNKAVDITVPTKVSDIDNDLSFIDNTVNNLVNYYTKTEVDNKVSSVYKYQGSVNTYADLPSSGQVVGDVYNVVTADTTHGIPAGGNVAWNGTAWDYLGGDIDFSNYYTKAQVDTSLNGKVDKVTGKQLSTEDYTSAEKTKLANIEANAAVNLIESISVNNTTVSPVNKNVNIPIKTINNESLLGTGNIDTSSGGGTWGNIGGTLSNQTDLQDALDAKQDELVSNVNIRTVNGNSILGSGNISISGSSTNKLDFVYYENTRRPEKSSYLNSLIPYDLDGDGTIVTPGTDNEIYLVDLSVCTLTHGYVQFIVGEGSEEEEINLEANDILIPYHAVDGQYTVGDNVVLIRGTVLTKYTITGVNNNGIVTQITKTSSADIKHVHHITANGQNKLLFSSDINVNDIVITRDFILDGTIVSGFTFPIGTLFFFKYNASAGPSSLAAPGLIIMPTGEMYQVTELAALVITGTTIKPYVDLTSNQTIGGVKTFSSVPVCATQPTSNDELANKAYVDAQASGTVINGNVTAPTDTTKVTTSTEMFTGKYFIDDDGLKYPIYTMTWYVPKDSASNVSTSQHYAKFIPTNNFATGFSSPTGLKRLFVLQDYSCIRTTYWDYPFSRFDAGCSIPTDSTVSANTWKNIKGSAVGYYSGVQSNINNSALVDFSVGKGLYDGMVYARIVIEYTKIGEGVTP